MNSLEASFVPKPNSIKKMMRVPPLTSNLPHNNVFAIAIKIEHLKKKLANNSFRPEWTKTLLGMSDF